MNFRDAESKARELGATVEGVIDWTWAKGFPTPEAGQQFVQWLEENGFDHRGYYPAQPDSSNPNLRVDGVRFR